MREVCFLFPSRGNAFMKELLAAVAAAVAEEGVEVSLHADRYPPLRDGVAYVAIPHEFFELAPDGGSPTPGHLQRTVGFCVELPGGAWFGPTCRHGRRLGALVDIRASGVHALHMAGLAAVHAPLGYTPQWDRWHGDESARRPLDLVYMSAAEDRRDRVLAGCAETLAGRSARLLIPPERPKPGPGPSFLVAGEKHELLRSTKVLLNLHRAGTQGLEWPRVLEAISNGCVVVTERSLDMAPLVPGEHLVVGRAESVCLLADRLLDDPERLAAMRRSAYDFVRGELPMSRGARTLVEVAEDVVRRRIRPGSALEEERDPGKPMPELLAEAVAPLRTALKRVLIETRETRRELSDLARGRGEPLGVRAEPVITTPAYTAASPRVTVGISLYNYEAEIGDALASVAASEYEDFEVLVLDDASTDKSSAVVQHFLAGHPWIPAVLLQHSRNAGLARARNAISELARGELVFILDADNGLYPHGLGRLVEALDAAPDAAFAYPIIAVHEQGAPAGLLSRHGWDPSLLAKANFVDAMALIRRAALLDIGGYCDDPRLVGFEDYDLWCQMAQRGWRGIQVPEILAWYRRSGHSMLSLTSLDTTEARSLLSARAPAVFGAVR